MKINVFRTQAKIGSTVRYKEKEYKLTNIKDEFNTLKAVVCLIIISFEL